MESIYTRSEKTNVCTIMLFRRFYINSFDVLLKLPTICIGYYGDINSIKMKNEKKKKEANMPMSLYRHHYAHTQIDLYKYINALKRINALLQ